MSVSRRLVLALPGAALASAAGPAREPSPALTPRQVVEAQLAAFRANDDPEPDAGIRVAFAFASPTNRRSTGPVERFVAMVKNPLYAPLLGHRAAHLSETSERNGLARIKVTLLDSTGAEAAFVWILSLQRGEPHAGCWLTDAVMRVEVRDSPFRVARLARRRPVSSC